jgi:hypothetical protein
MFNTAQLLCTFFPVSYLSLSVFPVFGICLILYAPLLPLREDMDQKIRNEVEE